MGNGGFDHKRSHPAIMKLLIHNKESLEATDVQALPLPQNEIVLRTPS